MKVIICGGRPNTYTTTVEDVWRKLDTLQAELKMTYVITGGALGVDSYAHMWAVARGLQTEIVRPDWKSHGRAGGIRRNTEMLLRKPDLVVAFPGGSGTANMVFQARSRGTPVVQFYREKENA